MEALRLGCHGLKDGQPCQVCNSLRKGRGKAGCGRDCACICGDFADPGLDHIPATDWRRWVPPEIRREVLVFMTRAFIVGAVLGGAGAAFYWKYSQSHEKIFQGAIILGALAFTMPAFATSLKLMLLMFYMGCSSAEKSDGVFENMKSITDGLKPLTQNTPEIREKFDRLLKALENLIAPPKAPTSSRSGLLERGIRKTEGNETGVGSFPVGEAGSIPQGSVVGTGDVVAPLRPRASSWGETVPGDDDAQPVPLAPDGHAT
jgi:hypothetical protein